MQLHIPVEPESAWERFWATAIDDEYLRLRYSAFGFRGWVWLPQARSAMLGWAMPGQDMLCFPESKNTCLPCRYAPVTHNTWRYVTPTSNWCGMHPCRCSCYAVQYVSRRLLLAPPRDKILSIYNKSIGNLLSHERDFCVKYESAILTQIIMLKCSPVAVFNYMMDFFYNVHILDIRQVT